MKAKHLKRLIEASDCIDTAKSDMVFAYKALDLEYAKERIQSATEEVVRATALIDKIIAYYAD